MALLNALLLVVFFFFGRPGIRVDSPFGGCLSLSEHQKDAAVDPKVQNKIEPPIGILMMVHYNPDITG